MPEKGPQVPKGNETGAQIGTESANRQDEYRALPRAVGLMTFVSTRRPPTPECAPSAEQRSGAPQGEHGVGWQERCWNRFPPSLFTPACTGAAGIWPPRGPERGTEPAHTQQKHPPTAWLDVTRGHAPNARIRKRAKPKTRKGQTGQTRRRQTGRQEGQKAGK